MNTELVEAYRQIKAGGLGFYEQKRGLIEVSGKEAVQFLNGMITNDVAKLEDGAQMSAAFPNAQGRLLATARVQRRGDKFLFATEEATREKMFNNLFRFTYAGDFFVEDLSNDFRCLTIFNKKPESETSGNIEFQTNFGAEYFVSNDAAENFISELKNRNAVEIADELYEVLRIENGEPRYAVDADETTIIPELGDEAISYTKGCYIGQEIIARIHFRGHVAKKLTGLISEAEIKIGDELQSLDGKNAGKITSVAYSPSFQKFIALAFVRYEFLAEGTKLVIGDTTATVKNLPLVEDLI